MEKKAKIGEEVIILSVLWTDDSSHVGKVVTLKHRETQATWATGTLPDGSTVVLHRYVPATELNKALV